MIKHPVLATLLLLTSFWFLSGCGLFYQRSLPSGIEPVRDFELDRYLGTWYEIARLDHSFERGLSRVTAEYSLNDDGSVRVVNRGFDEAGSRWKSVTGKAYFVDDRETGFLRVSFFGPFYSSYIVFDLDRVKYSYALVAGANKKYLWVLSRDPELDEGTFSTLLQRAETAGFAVEDLIRVDQSR